MKKRYILLIVAVVAYVFFLTQCKTGYSEIPYGVWESEEPYLCLDIVTNIKDNYGNVYYGKYEKDKERIDVVFIVDTIRGGIEIHDMDDLWVGDGEEMLHHDYPYFFGYYTFTDEEMVLELTPHFEEMHGFKTIKFKKIQDYFGG
jgi:hypothetical protein